MRSNKLILSVIIISALLFVFSGCIFDDSSDSLSSADTFRIQISGTSMEPMIHDGEIITVIRTDESFDYRVDQIIAFKYDSSDDTYIVHRILKRVNYTGRIGYITKGDNMSEPDETVIYPENIYGVYKKTY